MDIDSDSDSSDDSSPFDPNELLCIGIDSAFCKLAYSVKYAIYNNFILEGDETKDESQDINILKDYEMSLDSIHTLLYGLFTNQNSPDQPIPHDVESKIPPKIHELFQQLYQESCKAYRNNDDPKVRNVYRIFIHNVFHVYPYRMTDAEE